VAYEAVSSAVSCVRSGLTIRSFRHGTMGTDEIKNRIDRYFSFYQERAKNLQNFSPTNEIEAGLLALCYLDALSQSARQHGIVDVIREFSHWTKLPGLVSLGRLYIFVRWLLTLPEPTRKNKYLSRYLKKEFWRSDLKEIKEVVKDLKAIHPRRQWKLLMTALEEFARRRLAEAPRERKLFLRAQNIDLPPNDIARKFSEFISKDADSFWFGYIDGYIGNKERFRMLIENKNTDQLYRLFEFFTLSNVFRRDYRNPMIHKTVVPSQGRDWAEKVNEPYYWFSPAGVNDLAVNTVVPFRFFAGAFIECLNNYERFCRDKMRDPMPHLSEI
jgi:hypothetical protein